MHVICLGFLCETGVNPNSCAQLCPVGNGRPAAVPQKFHNWPALYRGASPIAKFAENLCFCVRRLIRKPAAATDPQRYRVKFQAALYGDPYVCRIPTGRSTIRRRDRRAFGPARRRRNHADQSAAARTLDDEAAPACGERIHHGRSYGFTARSCAENSSARTRAKRVAAAAAFAAPRGCHKTVTFIAASQPIAHRHMRKLEV